MTSESTLFMEKWTSITTCDWLKSNKGLDLRVLRMVLSRAKYGQTWFQIWRVNIRQVACHKMSVFSPWSPKITFKLKKFFWLSKIFSKNAWYFEKTRGTKIPVVINSIVTKMTQEIQMTPFELQWPLFLAFGKTKKCDVFSECSILWICKGPFSKLKQNCTILRQSS